MRWFVGLSLLIIVLAMILWAVATGLDRGVASAIERGAERRLGVPVEVEAADTGLRDQYLQLTGLRIANPEAFAQPWFMTLDKGRIQVEARSLFGKERAQIPEIVLQDIDLLLARNEAGEINYRQILDHLEQQQPESAEPAEDGKRFQIDRLLIRDIEVAFSGFPVVGDRQMRIEQIELTELQDDLSSGDIAALVVKEIMEEVVKQGAPIRDALQDQIKEQVQQGQERIEERVRQGLGDALGRRD